MLINVKFKNEYAPVKTKVSFNFKARSRKDCFKKRKRRRKFYAFGKDIG